MIPIPIDRRTTTTPLPTPTPTPSPTNTSPISRPRLSPSPSQPSLWRALFGSHTHARPPSVRARQLTISRPRARPGATVSQRGERHLLSFFRSKAGDRQKSACVGSDMGRRFHLGLVDFPSESQNLWTYVNGFSTSFLLLGSKREVAEVTKTYAI